jgi:hypothetical protein
MEIAEQEEMYLLRALFSNSAFSAFKKTRSILR